MAIRKKQKHLSINIDKTNGFTLIEIIVSMIIVVVISSLLVMYLMGSTEAFDRVQSRKSLIMDATSCITKYNRETYSIHNIFYASTKNFQFSTTRDTNIVIDYEINNDRTFTRQLGTGNKELLSRDIDYDASYFNFYDVNDNVATPIRRIRLSLLFSKNNQSVRFTSDITPEPLREN